MYKKGNVPVILWILMKIYRLDVPVDAIIRKGYLLAIPVGKVRIKSRRVKKNKNLLVLLIS
jgi:hypothetical protein